MFSHCPAYYVRNYRKCLYLIGIMYILGLIACHFDYEDPEESIYMMTQTYLASIMIYGMIEAWSWWYRRNYMHGSFRDYRVIMKMVMSSEEAANDIGFNMAVWPATKAYNVYSKWGNDIRVFWVFTIIVTSSILMFSIGIV